NNNLKKFNEFLEFCKDKKRCFVIGNGPSLTKSDMNLLNNEITFVCNRFFHIYKDYQSTAYFCQDPTILKNEIENIKKAKSKFKLVNPLIKFKNMFFKKNYGEDFIFYHAIRKNCLNGENPDFAKSFEDGVYEGCTITFSMIQIAVLLGFKEIYLLGIDFNYIIKDGKVDDSSYPKQLKGLKTGGLPNIEYSYKAFKKCAQYANEQGITIINCSRNTKLDAFKIKNLEEVL
ncbi:DUF115 domain-containing protein, partial [bacterium]|nr:DUF115 domain-containing protein [bacterium]